MERKHLPAGQGIEIVRRPHDKRVAIEQQGIEIKAEGKPVAHQTAATGLVYLLLDCSSSMTDGNKLSQAKQGATGFAKDARTKGYAIGLIRFDSSAQHLCSPEDGMGALQRHIEALVADGSTNMAAAIALAAAKLEGRPGFLAIVVVTDGMPDDEGEALGAANDAKRSGIDMITIGTDDADRAFLEKLASRRELAVKIETPQLAQGIVSAVRLLRGSSE